MSEQSTTQTAGGGSQGRPEISVEALKAAYRSAAFGDIVSILMRSPAHKRLPLETLRIFVVPAIANRQFLIAKIKPKANPEADSIPAGLAMWASVSDEVDQRLRSNESGQISLKPDEWKSGDRLWLVDLVAPSKLVPQMVNDLEQKVAQGRDMAVQVKSQDGGSRVTTLRSLMGQAAA